MDLEVICYSNLGYQIFCLQKESSSNGEMSEYWAIHFKFTSPYMDKGTRKKCVPTRRSTGILGDLL